MATKSLAARIDKEEQHTMHQDEIARHLCSLSVAVMPMDTWGETAYFYNQNGQLPRGVYFATLKSKNGDNDRASHLDRPSVYRLSLGLGKTAYQSLFGTVPTRPVAGGVVDTGHDFTALDTLLPHPVYAWMGWVCVLSPSVATFERMKPLIEDAHQLAMQKFDKRVKSL